MHRSLTPYRFLYGVRTKKKNLPYMRFSRRGDPIWVGEHTTDALTQSVDKIFKCSWPNVLLEKVRLRSVVLSPLICHIG